MSFFGIYPVANGYFMKGLPYKTTDLRFCVGTVWGCIIDPSINIVIEEKEDFERTLLFYKKDHGVLRFNKICCITKYYKEKGGMQSRLRSHDRKETSKQSCYYLLEKFPEYCTLHTSKKSGIYEVKLKETK